MADGLKLSLGAIFMDWPTSGYSFLTFTLNSSTDAIYWIYSAPDAATVTHLFLNVSAVLSPPTFRLNIYACVDGTKSGSVLETTGDLTLSAGAAWHALSSSYALTRGSKYVIALEYQTGTVGGSNYATINYAMSDPNAQGIPFPVTVDSGVSTKQQRAPVFGYKSASKSYGYPVKAVGSIEYHSDTTPDEYGLSFVIPSAWFASYEVVGVRAFIIQKTAANSCILKLYDSDGSTVLQSVTVDYDDCATLGSFRNAQIFFDETTLSTLTTGSRYRVAFQPQDSTDNMSVTYIDVVDAGDMSAFEMGEQFYSTSRTGAGSFNDLTTRRFAIEPVLEVVTASSGGGNANVLRGSTVAAR